MRGVKLPGEVERISDTLLVLESGVAHSLPTALQDAIAGTDGLVKARSVLECVRL